MHIHIVGIAGTFMAGVASLARELGYTVTGEDEACYPPMSTQLEAQGISFREGYDASQLPLDADCYVIGNALSRGHPVVERIMNERLPYYSGAGWLRDFVLKDKHVIAVAGTHGKTTTSALAAHILQQAGFEPGYLIGGVVRDLPTSAHLGRSKYFVIEADEYDTAFFDKRPKFMHYAPNTLILNNCEFDHADIYPNLEAIMQQFHYLCRTVAGRDAIIANAMDPHLRDVLARGCWSELINFSLDNDSDAAWQADFGAHTREFTITHRGKIFCDVRWNHMGKHNISNALAVAAALHHVGLSSEQICQGLESFRGVKRRMELVGCAGDITIYDDFAHHPTAIQTTLEGLKANLEQGRLLAIAECASNSMKKGVFASRLPDAFSAADEVFLLKSDEDDDLPNMMGAFHNSAHLFNSVDELLTAAVKSVRPSDTILVMSNKGFGGIQQRLLDALR